MADDLITGLAEVGVVPLVTLNSVEEAVPLARALEAGGVPVAEVTFRSPHAIEGMKRIRDMVPGVTLIAGTVHTPEQAVAAVDAGCTGLVTPAFDEDVVDWALEHDIAILPGTAVPSDVEKAYDRGLRYAKFFPAEAYGGVKTLKALSGPFAEMGFLPTGGVSLDNAADYMSLANVFAVGGSFPVPSQAQKQGDWNAVSEACRKARALLEPVIAAKREQTGN
ncbi:bifunctional 4-hydroxy-2-oxoglutarate aldolase/2-dehydro-3-deoxy-phosphogluconate aldolase [Bifidobacterium panos]|uniref:2-dehydro-3-deoxy-phosphogluconate aldolase n=1 Tax=Bifidobacterium panos TaxID=2675321 RepID=A0ABX1SV09_9BIFI|nr:bifunctional 4-hydroxy-2-oxoglutarate aldolase/2-dehydro-3-deoxy-phosphogluconate aldolase [Bifidobacterium sp. DSM 109963]NMN01665.1 2-dehydro-3-deoxy-phosphogluconate aldolase [Bifidobacterium sp. DSM 109963]